jgi:hypothetical protein
MLTLQCRNFLCLRNFFYYKEPFRTQCDLRFCHARFYYLRSNIQIHYNSRKTHLWKASGGELAEGHRSSSPLGSLEAWTSSPSPHTLHIHRHHLHPHLIAILLYFLYLIVDLHKFPSIYMYPHLHSYCDDVIFLHEWVVTWVLGDDETLAWIIC